MRIIAGSAKGHNIKSLKGLSTRPTLERIREAVFNVLGSKVPEAVVLDLFAGTGAIGIEALSRGAKYCYFNDSAKNAIEIIRVNLLHCRLLENSQIYSMDALNLIEHLQKQQNIKLDIVYIDPPYERGLYENILVKLDESNLLKQGSVVIAETNNKTVLPKDTGNLELVKKSSYGDTIIWYYQSKI